MCTCVIDVTKKGGGMRPHLEVHKKNGRYSPPPSLEKEKYSPPPSLEKEKRQKKSSPPIWTQQKGTLVNEGVL